MDITHYLKAGYPGLCITTIEPQRAIATIQTGTWQAFTWEPHRGT